MTNFIRFSSSWILFSMVFLLFNIMGFKFASLKFIGYFGLLFSVKSQIWIVSLQVCWSALLLEILFAGWLLHKAILEVRMSKNFLSYGLKSFCNILFLESIAFCPSVCLASLLFSIQKTINILTRKVNPLRYCNPNELYLQNCIPHSVYIMWHLWKFN